MPTTIPASVLNRYSDALEAELTRWLDCRSPIGKHYDLLAYHMGWADENLRRNAGPRGKRFRPLLCLLSCEAVGGEWAGALPIGAAIEFLHNFSLIHDDIEDHDESRHHRPSLWKLIGEPLAINAGDAMLALSGLAALARADVAEVAVEFQQTALALTEGQYLDMSFETRSDVTPEQYFEMIALKTGALITYACAAGARLGGGSADQIEALRTFGHHFGLAFQIRDDVAGIWAEQHQTGKVAGKDIVNRKKSLPVVLALSSATGGERQRLLNYYVDGQDAVPTAITTMIEDLGIRDAVQSELNGHLDQAFSALDPVGLCEPFANQLRHVARELVAP
jgi:geranylgeranyl diphosphate synthase type I